jgi:hypothetical protein
MILLPSTVENPKFLAVRHFASYAETGHRIIRVNMKNIRPALDRLAKEIPRGEEVYTMGMDIDPESARITYHAFNHFPNPKRIRCVCVLEDPDSVRYVYKQDRYPSMPYYYNSEPFIRYDYRDVDIYYHSVCQPGNFGETSVLISKYGDFWGVSESKYERLRMENVKQLACIHKIKKILDIGSYLGQLDDLLELNGIKVTRTDINSEILANDSRVLDFCKLSVDSLTELCKSVNCVLFASILFAYTEKSKEIDKILVALARANPRYILYEDSCLNFGNGSSNEWLEFFSRLGYTLKEDRKLDQAVENFHGKKSIQRSGSVSILLEHYTYHPQGKDV